MDLGIKGTGQKKTKTLKGCLGRQTGVLKKRKGETERKVGELFCAPLMACLKLAEELQ